MGCGAECLGRLDSWANVHQPLFLASQPVFGIGRMKCWHPECLNACQEFADPATTPSPRTPSSRLPGTPSFSGSPGIGPLGGGRFLSWCGISQSISKSSPLTMSCLPAWGGTAIQTDNTRAPHPLTTHFPQKHTLSGRQGAPPPKSFPSNADSEERDFKAPFAKTKTSTSSTTTSTWLVVVDRGTEQLPPPPHSLPMAFWKETFFRN